MSEKTGYTFFGCLFCIIILCAITIPFAFTYVEYDEWAFYKNTLANEVDTSEVYDEGRYFWGWPGTAVRFPNNYQFVSFTGPEALAIFTQDGLEFEVEASFQYKLVKEELATMFGKFSINYHQQIMAVGKAKIKNMLPRFNLTEMVEDREAISAKVWKELHDDVLSKAHAVVPASKFQLRKMTLPVQIIGKYLENAIQRQDNKKTMSQQEADLIRKRTEVVEQQYDANVTRILEKARAQGDLIKNTALYEARAIVAKAEGKGYAQLFKTLGIEDDLDLQQKFLRVDAILEGEVKPQMLFGLNTATVMLNGK